MSITNADIEYFAASLSSTPSGKLRQMRQLLDGEIANRVKVFLDAAIVEHELHAAEVSFVQMRLLNHKANRISYEHGNVRKKYDRIRKSSLAMVREDICTLVADQLSQKLSGV